MTIHHRREPQRRNGSLLHAVHSAEKKVENWAQQFDDARFEMRQQTLAKRNQLIHYVKAKPFASLGFAALGGAMLALLLKR